MKMPIMAADIRATSAATNIVFTPYSDNISLLFGAIPPTAPITIPIEAKFANPQRTYVAIIADLVDVKAPVLSISAILW
jgi:hypothetical protein